MKTSELRGSALDWAVAKCEGRTDICLDYSTDWSQGGPIIERECIQLGGGPVNGEPQWFALRVKDDKSACHKGHGPTPLIAAMRCYVASRLGDEVNIPEELK